MTHAPGGGPLVSVVMPFKDAAGHLREAADSVLAQTWPHVELVLVDDAGTDGSDRLAHEVAAGSGGRARVVAHPGRVNRGIGASRHLGIRESRGELVALLDADDVWEPGHLEHEVAVLQAHPTAAMVCCRTWVWMSWERPGHVDELSQLAFAPGVEVDGVRMLEAVLRNGGYSPSPCTVLVRRSALGDWLPVVDDFPGMYEDQVLYASLWLRGRVVLSGGTTTWYRQHAGSISAQELLDDEDARFDGGRDRYLDWLEGHPLLTDPVVRAQLARNQRELAARTAARAAGASAPPPLGPALPARTRGGLVRVRGAASRAVTRAERAQERRGSPLSPAGRAAVALWQQRLAHLLELHAADVRGRALVVGDASGLIDDVRARCDDHVPLPVVPFASGPAHPLAQLPTAGHEWLLVVDRSRRTWGAADLRHLRRALAPGGVLLLVVRTADGALQAAAREAFGVDHLRSFWQGTPGPGRRPLLALRAAVPV